MKVARLMTPMMSHGLCRPAADRAGVQPPSPPDDDDGLARLRRGRSPDFEAAAFAMLSAP